MLCLKHILFKKKIMIKTQMNSRRKENMLLHFM